MLGRAIPHTPSTVIKKSCLLTLVTEFSLHQEGAKRTEPGYFQWCIASVQEAMGTNWSTVGFFWTSGNTFFIARVTKHWCSLPRCGWHFPPWRYLNTTWTHPTQPALGGTAWAGVGPGDLQRSSQPQLFRDSVNNILKSTTAPLHSEASLCIHSKNVLGCYVKRGMQNVFLGTRKNKSFGKDHNKLEINNPKEKKRMYVL